MIPVDTPLCSAKRLNEVLNDMKFSMDQQIDAEHTPYEPCEDEVQVRNFAKELHERLARYSDHLE